MLDIRGQGGLQLSVNLNDIDGLPFVSYGILAVGRELFDRFQISLAGTVGRGGWVDYAQAQRQVFEQLHPASRDTRSRVRTSPSPRRKRRKPRCRDAAQENAQATVPDAARESAGGAAEGVRVPEEGAASSAAEEASGEEAAQAPPWPRRPARRGPRPGGGSGGGPV